MMLALATGMTFHNKEESANGTCSYTQHSQQDISPSFQLPCAVVQQANSPARNRGAIIDTFTTIRDAIREPVLKMVLAMAMRASLLPIPSVITMMWFLPFRLKKKITFVLTYRNYSFWIKLKVPFIVNVGLI